MFVVRVAPTILIASLLSVSSAEAGVSQEVWQGIQDGTRVIRADVISLKKIPIPKPSNLRRFVRNEQAAIELGKALFWDMQIGSDGIQACASCHFNAGADSRVKNQLSPGLFRANQDGTANPDNTFQTGAPNHRLRPNDYPFHVKADSRRFTSDIVRDSNDVVSSQGVHFGEFVRGLLHAIFSPDPDGFRVDNTNTRRVEPRHTPTVINAVFNHRQLWDGRASDTFNGVSPFGADDPEAFVYVAPRKRALIRKRIRIDNASLASQAVGPPTSDFEMSAHGRAWPDIGYKVLTRPSFGNRGLIPLLRQFVHPEDSVLGRLANPRGKGLRVKNYRTLIKRAFKKAWWQSTKFVRLNADGSRTIVDSRREHDDNVFSHMEINFSLFFGLAVQLYESTLVSDDSPVDRFLDGDANALTKSELIGFHIADVEGRCINCHGGGEFTFASVSKVSTQGLTRIRRGDLIDEGFNNIGVRPTLEDLGVGGTDPFGNPLGFARRTHLGLFDNDKISGTNDERAADLGNDGAFKIPTLRNVELTAPYFHNGGELTLDDVIDFYFRGGNFRTVNEEESHPIIGYSADRRSESKITGLGILRGPLLNSGPGLDEQDKANIVAFLRALTDERVRYERAPFDHPQLFIPSGHQGDTRRVFDARGKATDILLEIPAVGAAGVTTPQPTFAHNLSHEEDPQPRLEKVRNRQHSAEPIEAEAPQPGSDALQGCASHDRTMPSLLHPAFLLLFYRRKRNCAATTT